MAPTIASLGPPPLHPPPKPPRSSLSLPRVPSLSRLLPRMLSPKTPAPQPANDAFEAVLDANERILKQINEVYTKVWQAPKGGSVFGSPSLRSSGSASLPTAGKPTPELLRPKEEGILAICAKLGLSCIAPRRKINVMIVGNHSAGKSSYINWYIGEHVQRTGVAVETQGFTFCTSGKKRDTLKGQATTQLFTHLQEELEKFAPAIYNGLQTEVSTSKERAFSLITFIDTPGLVDGSFTYLFPVEDAILAVAKHTDLIYIFFDPIGQALCDRTMKVIERLNQDHAEKLRYFLSKADTVPNERDRQKVVVQITQNLSSRVRNAHAFELPSLYIPDFSGNCRIENILDKTCEEMQQTINQSVQNNLNKLEKDVMAVNTRIEQLLADDTVARQYNRKAASYGWAAFLVSLLAPLLVVAVGLHRSGLVASMAARTAVPPELVAAFGDTCDALVAPHAEAADAVVAQSAAVSAASVSSSSAGLLSLKQLLGAASLFFVFMQIVSRLVRRYEPCFSKRELANLLGTQRYVTHDVLELKKNLYKTYLDEVSSDPSGMNL